MPLRPTKLPDILLDFSFLTFCVKVFKIKPGRGNYITYCCAKCNLLTFPNLISFLQERDLIPYPYKMTEKVTV
jgi:hypothetical protein